MAFYGLGSGLGLFFGKLALQCVIKNEIMFLKNWKRKNKIFQV